MRLEGRSQSYGVLEPSAVGEVRRAVAVLAEALGVGESEGGKAALVATEIANNLHKHARDGVIVLRTVAKGLEILAIDRGPGMSSLESCLRDGFSTAGTPGTGLGTIVRVSDKWDIYSQPGVGTVAMAQVGAEPRKEAKPPGLAVGAVCLPMKGEIECGDNWATVSSPRGPRIMLADGLGHGPDAAEASEEAEKVFRSHPEGSLSEVMQGIHNALRKTRGAAVAIAELDPEQGLLRYVGVGNISGTILSNGTTRSLVSQNGTVGHELRRLQEFQYPWAAESTLVMNSDGLVSKWDLFKYPGLAARHPGVAAGVLWRDFTRGRDDVTVVVIREGPG